MDYDDDEDDEDYNPPSKKPEPVTEPGKTLVSSGKSKRKSPDSKGAVCELRKKPRLEQQSSDGMVVVVAPCATCIPSDSPNKDTAPIASTNDTDGSSNDSIVEKNAAVPDNCSNCLSNTVDTRQPSGEDCRTPSTNNSPREMANNDADLTGSEPYPVR